MERLYKGYGSSIFNFYQISNIVGWASGSLLILLASNIPAPQEILGYFFI
jgi:hypothetical protein